jgi:hypothetical protein
VADWPTDNGQPAFTDLRRPSFRRPPELAAPLLETDPGALACNVSGAGTIPPPGSVMPR